MDQHEGEKNWKHSVKRLFREQPDRIIELLFTGSVVLFAFLGWRNAQSGSEQTNQLIAAAKYNAYAADRNAQAASNFAESARGINQGVDNAVTRLQAQAAATELARETADANARAQLSETVSNFQREQRPWVGSSHSDVRVVSLQREQ